MKRIKELYESDKLSDEKKEALKLAFRQKFPQYAEDISGKTEDKIMQENTIKMSTPKAKVKTKAFAGVAAAALVLVAGMAVAKHIYTARSLQEPAGSQVDVGGNDISQSDTDEGNPMFENEEEFTAAKNFFCAASSAYVDLYDNGKNIVSHGDIIDGRMILISREEKSVNSSGTVSELEFAALTDEYARGMGYDAAEWDVEIVLNSDEEMPVMCARVYLDRAQGIYESYPPEDSLKEGNDDGRVDLVEYTYTNKDAKMLFDEAKKVFEEFKAEGYDISCKDVSERDYVINPTSGLHIDDVEKKPANTTDNIIDADEFDKALYDLGGMAYTIAFNHPCNFVIEFTSDDSGYATGIASAKVVINNRESSEKFDTFTWKDGDVLDDAKPSVPDVVDLESYIAENIIKSANYNVVLCSQYDDSVPEGCVIESEPAAGTPLKPGETVTLFISKGKQGENTDTDELSYEGSYTAEFLSKLDNRHFSAEYEYYDSDDVSPDGRYLALRQSVEMNGDITHRLTTNYSVSETDTWEEYMTSTEHYSSINGGEWELGQLTGSTPPYYLMMESHFEVQEPVFINREENEDKVTEYFNEGDDDYIYTYDKNTGNILSCKHIWRYDVNGKTQTSTTERVFTKFSEDVGELTLPDIG